MPHWGLQRRGCATAGEDDPSTAWLPTRQAPQATPGLPRTDPLRTLGDVSAVVEPSKDARLDLRLPKDTRALIVEAAALSGASLTDYVLNLVVPAARRDVLESRAIRLAREAWDDFLDILDRPDNADLAEFREHTPSWGTSRP